MTIKEIMNYGKLKLENIDMPILKLRMLISVILNQTKEYIMVHDEINLTKMQEKKIKEGILKLSKNIPIQYIIGKQEFMGLEIKVNENVLIPRPDTEILVEEVIKEYKNKKVKILDLCTGSGCIAISLKYYIKFAKLFAADISEEALKVAKKNAIYNNVNINFIKSNMFSSIGNQKFNVIVSNPPYIKSNVIEKLEKEVKKEPLIALDGGKDGLNFYREIIKEAYNYLEDNGKIFLEIGYDQKEKLINLVKSDNRYKYMYCKKDLANNNRVIVIRKE